MSPISRHRRPIALLAALALSVVGLSVVPAVAASATSTASAKAQLLTFLNAQREHASASPWTPVAFLDGWTQSYAEIYAGCNGCLNPSKHLEYFPADTKDVALWRVSGHTSAERVAKLETLISNNSGEDSFPADAWGSIGYTVVGHTGYLLVDGFKISSTEFPFSSVSPGNAEIFGALTVGSALSVTVPTLSPTPTSYTYQWTRTKGGSTTNVGTDSSTYVVSASDLGATFTVEALANLSDYVTAGFVASTADNEVKHGQFTGVKLVSGGSRVVGQSIDFSVDASPSPDTYAWTWYRNGKKFANVGNSYIFTQADKGKRIDVKVVISSPGFDSVTLQTHTTKKVKATLPI
jgi:hypothetical protein